jgi:hypothetical protein
MRCPALDHFGLRSRRPAAGRDARAARAQRDASVEIIERGLEDYGFLQAPQLLPALSLPLMIEVQCFEWARKAS